MEKCDAVESIVRESCLTIMNVVSIGDVSGIVEDGHYVLE